MMYKKVGVGQYKSCSTPTIDKEPRRTEPDKEP